MLKILKLATYPLLLLFLTINTHSLYKSAIGVVLHSKLYLWVAVGIAIYFVVRQVLRLNLDFLETFTHEIIHAVVSIIFLHKIVSITINEKEGEIIHRGKNGSRNVFISLAPYCIPIYTFAFLLLRLIVIGKFLWVIDILVGLTTGFHGCAIRRQIGTHQNDIQNCGILFSFLFICAFILFNTSIILWSIKNGIGGAVLCWWENLMYLTKTL